MPYPYKITTTSNVFLPDPKGTPGPWEYNSNLYAVLHSTSADKLAVYRSTDSGATWSEQDSTNAKSNYQQDSRSYYSTIKIGSELLIAYLATWGGAIVIAKFDMSTDTWVSATDTSTATPRDTATGFKLVCNSSGDLYLVYEDLKPTTSNSRVNIVKKTGSTWGSSTVLFNPNVTELGVDNYYVRHVMVDPDDNLGILVTADEGANIYRSNGLVRYLHVSSGGSVGTFTVINYFPGGTESYEVGFSNPVCVGWSTGYAFIFPAPVGTNIGSSGTAQQMTASVIIVSPGLTPKSVRIILANPADNSYQALANNTVFCAAYYDEATESLFLYETYCNSAGTEFRIRRTCTKFKEDWSDWTDVLSVSGTSTDVISSLCIMPVGSGIGMLFDSWTTNTGHTYVRPHYHYEALPTCGETGCSAGGSNPFMHWSIG